MNVIFKRWLWLSLASAAVIAIVAPTPSPRAGTATNRDEGWTVPRIATTMDPLLLATNLQKTSLWGGQADVVAGADDRATQWRIAGVAGQARDRVVVVQFGDERLLPLKAGEKFPDGTPIAEVRENGVCVTLSGKRRFLPLSGQTIPIVW